MAEKEKASCTLNLAFSSSGTHLGCCYHILTLRCWGKRHMHLLGLYGHSNHLLVEDLVVKVMAQSIAHLWPVDKNTFLALSCRTLLPGLQDISHTHSQGCHGCTMDQQQARAKGVVMEVELGTVVLVLVVRGKEVKDSCICCYSIGIPEGTRPLRNKAYDLQPHYHEQRTSSDAATQRRLHKTLATSACT
jgi:hypothetical protein